MAEFRCNNCIHLKQGFCSKLKEVVPNSLAKLFYGGAAALYSGTVEYPSKCGIEKERHPNIEICVFPLECISQELSPVPTKVK